MTYAPQIQCVPTPLLSVSLTRPHGGGSEIGGEGGDVIGGEGGDIVGAE